MNLKELNFDQFYKRWALIASIMHGVCLILVIFLNVPTVFWAIPSLLLFGIYIVKMTYHIPSLPLWVGYANWVSILRLVGVLCLFSLHNYIKDIYLFWGFLAAILMDGVDGYLARRYNQSSRVGGILDMEIDAFLVLVLSYIQIEKGNIPDWIIIPGGFRFIYIWMILFIPQSTAKEMIPKLVRATIAVIFFFALIIPFVTEHWLITSLINISGILILISFGASFCSTIYYHILIRRTV